MLKKIYTRWKNIDRRIRWTTILSSALIAYTLIGFLLVPVILKSVVRNKLPELLNRPVEIQDVDFNPFTLHLYLEGFNLGKKSGEGNLFSFKSFDVNFDSFSIFRLSAVFDEVKICDPQVDITIFPDGSSISDLIPEAEEGAAKQEEASLFPFIVRDFVVSNGTCTVHDDFRNFNHRITGLNLIVPFTSSLSRDSDEFVQPSLEMVINGTPFALKGNTLPFNNTRRTEFNFTLDKAALGEYWIYLPIYKTTVLKSGTLSADLNLTFERSVNLLPRFMLGGQFAVSDFDLANKEDLSLLKFKQLDIDLAELSILRRILKINSVTLTDPFLKIGLKPDGSPDILDYLPQPAKVSQNATFAAVPQKEDEKGPDLLAEIASLSVIGGSVDFTDKAFGNGFNKLIGPVSVTASNLSTGKDKAGTYSFKVGTEGGEVVSVDGSLGIIPLAVKGFASVKNLNVPDYHKYLDPSVPLSVTSGKVGLGANFSIIPDNNGLVRLEGIKVDVKDLELSPKGGGDPLIGLGGFAVSNGTIDVGEKSVFIGSVDLHKALIKLMRDKQGIDLLKLIEKHQQEVDAEKEIKPVADEDSDKSDAGGWKVAVNRVNLTGSSFELIDKAATKKTSISISELKGGIKGLNFPDNKPLNLFLEGVINKRGKLKVSGQGVLSPVKVSGDLFVRKLRLRDFNGYLPPEMQMNIARGHIDVSGWWAFSAEDKPVATYKGKAQVKDLLLRDNKGDRQFFHLYELAVRDIDFVSDPLKVEVRLIDVLSPEVNVEKEADGTINISRILTGQLVVPVDEKVLEEQAEKAAEKVVVMSSGAAEPTALVANSTAQGTRNGASADNFIFLNKIAMANGTAIFKDHTVEPAFELDITKMRSAVRGLELPNGKRTELSFNATFDQQAPLVAEGYLQPTEDGADTDLKVTLINLDMTQLSPYTRKYIAYPVSTGMLSADVGVSLRGTLLSTNNVLDIYQFEVGEKVKSPDAPNIPIGLGLALLRDSSGNIRLDIPVEGNVDDPQFRLGRVIGRAILNVLIKAVTSPFALIGAMFGGGEDMDVLVFEPGIAVPKEASNSKIESVAKAMKSRPGLKLEISGFTSPQDIPALKVAMFKRMIAKPKFLELEADSKAPASIDDVVISEEEYPDYLEDAYENAPFEKPKNFLGIIESRPVPEMEQAIRDNIKVTDTDLADLARERAEKVRVILISEKGVESERVFLKSSATGKGAGPRVELGLQN
ncbi:DUF748 domain-containing protein [Maridesulfovibrio ferrireducens]|uniref:DUF748 domain-containing protein n=1 Tax=Maridesulfovibrio ferrireducens TaxID=246191 RepID=UPI001A22F6CE|nr:DUF748 domain-containing protein [Maridesulfovibrio ferrireducens]MBI9112737.1 DUF748 domain-containing protein [Maridesulfovibrio ferrireducens]